MFQYEIIIISPSHAIFTISTKTADFFTIHYSNLESSVKQTVFQLLLLILWEWGMEIAPVHVTWHNTINMIWTLPLKAPNMTIDVTSVAGCTFNHDKQAGV